MKQIITLITIIFSSILQAQTPTLPPAAQSNLGVFVTISRISQVTETGTQAIPKNALVSVIQNPAGQKFAVYGKLTLPIKDLTGLSKEPTLIAAASAKTEPSSGIESGATPIVSANSSEEIRMDDKGNVIAKSKTTVIKDAAGNTTKVIQGQRSGMTPERAASLAMAREKINQHKDDIEEFKSKHRKGTIVSGYDSKLKAMNDRLILMQAEYARMDAEYKKN